ncbi:ferritin-2, chloroplastic-like [Solanum dulcamara]|uniref:ferritin-2, chloroplastic-like n=1 Tax=Solanum dulcamara TaxID=45834 RepID=UPI0024862E32|nr:ferritin-2, chloroplastic-like [Solanum dulcamara]
MLLKVASAFALLNIHGENLSPMLPIYSHGSVLKNFSAKSGNGLVICASKGSSNKSLTGVVFEPFEEVKKKLMLVPTVPQVSLARHKYSDQSEAAINEQIKWVLVFLSLIHFFFALV